MADQKQTVRVGPHSNPAAALSGDGGAGNDGGNGIGESASTAERTEEIEATSLTAAMTNRVKPTLARMLSTG
jgi:hypothetical protein